MINKEFNDTMEVLSDHKDLLVEFTVARNKYNVVLHAIEEQRKQLNGSALSVKELS